MDKAIYDIFDKYLNDKLINTVISNSLEPDRIKKVQIRPIIMKESLCFQITEYKGKQVFHQNLNREEVIAMLPRWFEGLFRQIQLFAQDKETAVLISRKGKISVKENKRQMNMLPIMEHNRKKNYIINEGDKVPFLIDLGVMTIDGKIIKSKYDKFRQINRFLEFVEDVIESLQKDKVINVVDFGCGKSYLTFAMYYYLSEMKGYKVKITGLDLKEDVIIKCSKLKERYGYDGLEFLCGDIADYEGVDKVDMVVSLHACDTATDYAIYKAVKWGASVILAVPCCQHEVNKEMSDEVMLPLMKHGLVKERMSALITDAIRAECLDIIGYKTQVMEFIDMEHTPKNILIRAVKSRSIILEDCVEDKKRELLGCMKDMGITQKLVELLELYSR